MVHPVYMRHLCVTHLITIYDLKIILFLNFFLFQHNGYDIFTNQKYCYIKLVSIR